MNGPALRSGALRAAAVCGAFLLGAGALARIPLPASVRAAGMLALPCLLFAVLKREARRIERASELARASPRRRGPAAPAPAETVRAWTGRLFIDEKCWLRSKSPPRPPTSLSKRSFLEALSA